MSARARLYAATFAAMAKDGARSVARIMFVEQGKNRKDIAAELGVRDKTVGDWVNKGNWEDQRTAWLTNSQNVERALRGLIQTYTEQLTSMEQTGGDPKEKARLVDALVKTSKTLEVVRSERDITLNARLRVMEWVFAELQKHDAATHLKLVDFQSQLLDEAARIHG
jgi:transposase